MSWFVLVNEQSRGPFSKEQLSETIAKGGLGARDLVWQLGMLDWQPLAETEAFRQTPPRTRPITLPERTESVPSIETSRWKDSLKPAPPSVRSTRRLSLFSLFAGATVALVLSQILRSPRELNDLIEQDLNRFGNRPAIAQITGDPSAPQFLVRADLPDESLIEVRLGADRILARVKDRLAETARFSAVAPGAHLVSVFHNGRMVSRGMFFVGKETRGPVRVYPVPEDLELAK